MRPTAITLATLLLACQPPPEITWTGDHVAFGTEESERVCAGTLAYLDRRAGELIDRFDAGARMSEYYYLPDGVDDFCSDGSVGCTLGSRVYARHVPLQHELVHAARAGKLPRAFEEGLATHWGDPWPIDAIAPREALAALLETQEIETVAEYARAAHFMAFLAERGGHEGLVELDRQLDVDSSSARIDAALRRCSPG